MEIVRYEFEGQPLEFTRRDGEWWCDFEEAAQALGYASVASVRKLFARHRGAFLASETCSVEVTQDGQARSRRLFSPRGLEHLAILGRTEKCARFRRWILDVIEKLRAGARVVTEDQVFALLQRATSDLTQRFEAVLARKDEQLMALAGIAKLQASNAGRMLAYLSNSPEARRALREASDRRMGQRSLPFDDDFGVPAPLDPEAN